MSERRLLFLAHHLPFPPDTGGRLRTYYTLRALVDDFRVCLVSFTSEGERFSFDRSTADPCDVQGDLDGLHTVSKDRRRFSARSWAVHAASLATGRPYTEYLYDWTEFEKHIEVVTGQRAVDIVHVDTYHLYPVFSALPDVPTACTYHDIHSEILRRRAKTESSWLKAAYVSLQAGRLEKIERQVPADVDLNLVVSKRDRRTLSRCSPEARIEVVPNGLPLRMFEEDEASYEGGTTSELVFVGSGEWYPNMDGMRFFAREVLPHLQERVGGVTVTWVGSSTPELRREFGAVDGLELTGHVDDVTPYIEQAACVVVPLRCGGGTRLKILEAWAMRKAVVSTPIGCEGLEAHDGANLLVADRPEAFAEAVASVLENDDLRSSLGDEGRKTVENHYDWDRIGPRLASLYSDLL